MISDGDKLNRLEELKRKLFSNNYKTKIEYRDTYRSIQKEDVPDSWRSDNTPTQSKMKTNTKNSVFKNFFLFSVGFFILAVGYVAFQFFAGGNIVSNANIDIAILGNTFTAGGEDLPLQIEITNRNSSALELVDLVVEYPTGSSQGGNGEAIGEVERLRTSIGSIASGSVANENMKIVLFGEQGSVHNIKISLEYRLEGSNSIFVKEKEYQVTINSTPINLLVDAPIEVNPNEDLVFKIKSSLNASKPASDMLLRVDYPVGFQFVKATPAPALGNNIWDMGDLAPGAQSEIVILGKMIDVFDGEEKTFQVYTGTQSKTDKSLISVVFNSLAHTVSIKKPFIATKLFINGVYQREYAIDTKTLITADIRWVNNLDTKVNDLEIRAKISGNAINRNTIKSQKGFYNSLDDVIIWDKSYDNSFAEVGPGEEGIVTFSASPLALFSTANGMISQPVINIEVSIAGKQPFEGNLVQKLQNSESKTIRVISDIGFVAKALHFSGPFKNTGPIPPQAEKETTYTIVWTLTNTSNNISNVQIRSTLPPFIKFVGAINPATADLTYNASTRDIVWNVGALPRSTGIGGAARELAFQVSLTPSISQIGEAVTLITNAFLTGHDDFANVDIKASKAPLTTRLNSDPAFPSDGSLVVE